MGGNVASDQRFLKGAGTILEGVLEICGALFFLVKMRQYVTVSGQMPRMLYLL